MPEKPTPPKKLTEKNTKQEMLESYQELVKHLEEKRAAELNPVKKLEEKKTEEAVKVAATLPPDGIDREIGNLKADIGRLLSDISSKLETEVGRFSSIQTAVASKERELQELYGIEKAAASLAALIEAKNQKQHEFEAELARQKEELIREIDATRHAWETERKLHEAELKERDATEKRARDREKEESAYFFKREQQALRDKLNDEKVELEKELQRKKEAAEKDLAEREKSTVEMERELAQLREKAAAFPKDLDGAVAKAVKEATERVQLEAKNRDELQRRQFEGERNVLTTRVESLEKSLKDLVEQNARLSKQSEMAYQKVQDIAEKAIEGSSQAKSLADLQKFLAEQSRKAATEKA